jgi:hypothetical protein
MPKKLLLVELTYTAVIVIDTEQLDDDSDDAVTEDAEEQAKNYALDIVNDADEPYEVRVLKEVRSADDLLGSGWDATRLPYGDDADGETSVGEHLSS